MATATKPRRVDAEQLDIDVKRHSSSGVRSLNFSLPEGAKTVSTQYGSLPGGVTRLVGTDGKWDSANFDPADLEIRDAQLVLIATKYGGNTVGTRDAAAVKAAREKWDARWNEKRAGILKPFKAALLKHRAADAVRGPGASKLLALLVSVPDDFDDDLMDVAESLGHEPPSDGLSPAWAAKLSDADAAAILTGFLTATTRKISSPHETIEKAMQKVRADIRAGFLTATTRKISSPHETIEKAMQKVRADIRARKIPWLGKKKAAPAKGKQGKPAAVVLNEDDDEIGPEDDDA
jgi:hypothetical protein